MSYNRGGRGRGRGGRGRGGRGGFNNSGRGHSGFEGTGEKPHLQLCRDFLSKGNCSRGTGCNFQHVIQMHKTIQNSDKDTSRNYNSFFPSTDVAIWNDPAAGLKIFTSSHDGNWRLYNTANGFNEEVKHSMGGKVNKIMVESNFLFCAFEGTSIKVPAVNAGMIHAWNLGAPGDPPMELHMHETSPYAHAIGVSCFITQGDMCFSGGRDSVIRIWKFDTTMNSGKGGFKLIKAIFGHAGEITSLLMVGTMLWSSSTDKTIRLWDSSADWDCKYLITQNTQGTAGTVTSPTQGNQAVGVGHTDAVTSLTHFESAAGKFVLSSALDGKVKVWNSTNGECVSTTDCGVGIISMALTADPKNNALLVLGASNGKIIVRSLLQTSKTPPMCFLCSIDHRYSNCGHEGAVKSVIAGPSNTFYTAGEDGKVIIFQISGDLGL